jgi:phosphopentomutase
MDEIEAAMRESEGGLIFANLVDFDTVYGHRNETAGYAANLERFDARLAALLPRLLDDDLLVITADHGNDPTTPSTDHSREHVPVLLYGAAVKAGTDIGTRTTFADLGQTLAELFGVGPLDRGTSFLGQILSTGSRTQMQQEKERRGE